MSNHPINNELPSDRYAAVTPHDTTDLTDITRALYIGGAGNLVAVDAGGVTCTFVGLGAGQILPIRVKRVNATSTTATSIVALY